MRISLPISTWIDGVRSAMPRTRLSRKLLAAIAAHSVSSSSAVVLSTSSGVMRRPPITMPTESSASLVGSQQAEDAQRRDRPGEDRDQPVDELVADQACDQRDHHPSGGEAGGDAEQVGAARPGHLGACRARGHHQQYENDGAEIVGQCARELPQVDRPARRERVEIDAPAQQRRQQRFRCTAASRITPSWISTQTEATSRPAASKAYRRCRSAHAGGSSQFLDSPLGIVT